MVRIVLGILLLVAAGLKFMDDGSGTEDGFGPFASPVGRLVIAEAEALLGVWLLLGTTPHILWFVALLFFLGLAGMSLYLGMEGKPSCGCFGSKVSINPWYTSAFDVAALLALLGFPPRKASHESNLSVGPALRAGLCVFSLTAVILIGFFIGVSWFYGSPSRALNRLRGDTIVISPPRVYMGEVPASEGAWFSVQVTNLTETPIVIVGGKSGCRCLETYDLPVQIPAGGVVTVRLHVDYPSRPGPFEGQFRFLTDKGNVASASFAGIADDVAKPSAE